MSAQQEQQVIDTLSYFDQFNFPLKFSQLWQRLPCKLSQKKLKILLKKLLGQKRILQDKGYYVLTGRQKIFALRKKRRLISDNKQAQAEKFLAFAQKFPLILGVAFTGSMAAFNADAKADLDFLIVTKKNTLWLTRFVVLIFSSLCRRRPKLQLNISDQWDFNLWLEEKSLAMPSGKKSIYEAYELMQLRWLIDKANLKNKIIRDNAWIFQLVPNLARVKFKSKNKDQTFDFLALILAVLNYFFYLLQLFYRKLFHSSIGMSYHQAFFHLPASKEKFLEYKEGV